MNIVNVNGSSTNTLTGTNTQVMIVGQTNTLDNCARALITGASNIIQNASSYAIVGSSSCTIDANSSLSANQFIGGCTNVSFGTGTGNTGSNNVILASDGGTGSLAIGNSCNQILAKGNKVSITPSHCVVFTDDGSGFGGTTTIGSDNMMQCAFRQGFYFTTNTVRSAGVQVAPSATSWTSISDARLKNIFNDIPIDEAYAAIDKVRTVNYAWKDEAAFGYDCTGSE
jgi:hypothetical protein